MKGRGMLLVCAVCIGGALGFGSYRARGQQATTTYDATPASATGYVVSGRVVCGDTQRAARFAQVFLLPASDDEGSRGGGGRRPSARTDLDGNFTIPNVPPGDFYAVAQLTGYVNETQAVQAALSGTAGAALPAAVPKVHVGAGGATADLSLQRGGVIAGVVQWDDGTPAAGVSVSTQPAPATGLQGTNATDVGGPAGGFGNGAGRGGFGNFVVYGGSGFAQTDDRGRFRIAGLPGGSYLVRANVQAPAPVRGDERGFARTLNLAIYAPDKVRRTEAAPVRLAAGEERDDVAVTLGLRALHSVSGTVGATGATVRSGQVVLTDQTDGSLNRSGAINADGSFTVPYVPAGNYTLRVNASSQVASFGGRGGGGAPAGGTSAGVRFQQLTESVTVADADLTGLGLTVTVATASTP